jgi:ATP-dependent DNA helicase RecQ
MEARKLLLVAPTGGGKSLVYQLPATLLPGTTLVISPLIALMQDQVDALQSRRIPATFLASSLPDMELKERMDRARRGDYKLLYVAPERLASGWFQRFLSDLDCPLVAIDEAHCISEWGHDFRPEYLEIQDTLRNLPRARVLACTATATPIVRDEIVSRLGLGADTPQVLGGFARPNLILRATEAQTAHERRLHTDTQLREAIGAAGETTGTAIVYAPTRKTAAAEASRLAKLGWRCDFYHAGRDGPERTAIQHSFSSGDLDVVVATNAFGMGIDRADVRAVIHLAPPGSIEAFYQEVGRAGRDGKPAWGLLLTSNQDFPLRRRLLEMPVDDQPPPRAVIEHKWGLFLELMRWAEGGSCRHEAILRYFGASETEPGGCGRCDVCRSIRDTPTQNDEETAIIVRKALCGAARVHRRFGLGVAAKVLRGKADLRIMRAGLHRVTTYGALSDHSERWITSLLRRCVTAGWITFSGGDRPLAVLTREGSEVMYGQRPARLLLPPLSGPSSAPGAKKERNKRARPASAQSPAAADGLADAADQALFELLRTHRLALAKAQSAPPYIVASDRTLREIARTRPTSLQDLLLVHGIGPAKAERYGEGFLKVVAEALINDPGSPSLGAESSHS